MRRRTRRTAIFVALLALSAQAFANPTGQTVVSGSATFATSGSTLTITNSNNTIINWQGFSIGAGETTRFNQGSASSAVLNRVTSGTPSSLLGSLTSNGNVFLVNPNGVIFGNGATINVGGFAFSSSLSDADFLSGNHSFGGGIVIPSPLPVPTLQILPLTGPLSTGNITVASGGSLSSTGNVVCCSSNTSFVAGGGITTSSPISLSGGAITLTGGKLVTTGGTITLASKTPAVPGGPTSSQSAVSVASGGTASVTTVTLNLEKREVAF